MHVVVDCSVATSAMIRIQQLHDGYPRGMKDKQRGSPRTAPSRSKPSMGMLENWRGLACDVRLSNQRDFSHVDLEFLLIPASSSNLYNRRICRSPSFFLLAFGKPIRYLLLQSVKHSEFIKKPYPKWS